MIRFLADTCVLFCGNCYPCFVFLVTFPGGFQSQSRFCLTVFCRGECNVHSMRSTSGATPASLLTAGIHMQATCISLWRLIFHVSCPLPPPSEVSGSITGRTDVLKTFTWISATEIFVGRTSPSRACACIVVFCATPLYIYTVYIKSPCIIIVYPQTDVTVVFKVGQSQTGVNSAFELKNLFLFPWSTLIY